MTPDSRVGVRSFSKRIEGDCPVCGKTELRWRFAKKGRQFWRCEGCGVEKQHPLPTRRELEAYYDAEFDHGMYETFTAAEDMKRMTARQRLNEILVHLPPFGRWLDVGAANGVFVREARAEEIEAEGIELSAVAVERARDAELPVRCAALEDLDSSEKYDCITAFDVLEHVLDPTGFVESVVAHLRPGGHVAMTLPNEASLFCRLMGRRWWFYIPEEHLHYFNPRNVTRLFENAGLEILTVGRSFKPLTFNYGLTQFIEYNPLIYRLMKLAGVFLPARAREWIVPCYIGEMKVIARLPDPDAICEA
ncbi:MAG: class I SAM-dependent methyltransferase [Verrucomicrobiae bacterium]|nr:class I SAM-dependent methyltransferase [Verrucomicrobiae bacterium]MCP5540145.1 class I SAM-dependent methyltransferase [Akkermansiaceae bacterium]